MSNHEFRLQKGDDFADLLAVSGEVATGATGRTCELLVEEILLHTFKPGEHIVETRVAEMAGVSRGTVRSALQVLLARGLVERRGQSGVFVVDPGIGEMCDIFDARACVETGAAEMMAANGSIASKRALVEHADASHRALEQEAFGDYGILDVQFHISILHSCGNDAIAQALNGDVLVIKTHISYPAALPLLGMPAGCTHRDIARAIDEGDGACAREAMAEHIERSKRRLIRWSEQTGVTLAST